MGQEGSIADGQYPVALAGRVYALATNEGGSIKPGDLLTSAPTPGKAMKVRKLRKAQGSIIGKAMTSMESEEGLVLILINLQ